MYFYNSPLEYEDMPHQTIYIQFDGSIGFKEKLINKINRISVRSKSIKLSDIDLNYNFFVKIHLKESGSKSLDLHPIRRLQPNSDVIALARLLFKPKLIFDFTDLFEYKFVNKINICIDDSEQSIDDLCYLLRYYLNIHSHYYGNYCYVPLESHMISFNSAKFFIIAFLFYTLFDFSCDFNVTTVILHSLLYYICPVTVVLKKRKNHLFIYLLVFTIINFRIALLYCIYLYINGVTQLFKDKSSLITMKSTADDASVKSLH